SIFKMNTDSVLVESQLQPWSLQLKRPAVSQQCWSIWLSHGASVPLPAVRSIVAALLSLCFPDSLVLTTACSLT
ncbi:hypothetical protein GOODEAATRI_031847, partial [Goodea atripinnis]